LGELGEAVPLSLAETLLAFLLEDERDVDAGAPLDLGVAVEKAQTERLRELAADGRLARAHRADQVDIAGRQRGAPSSNDGAQTVKRKRPAQWPAFAAAGRRSADRRRPRSSETLDDQLMRDPSRRIRGVTKIRSSTLSLTTC